MHHRVSGFRTGLLLLAAAATGGMLAPMPAQAQDKDKADKPRLTIAAGAAVLPEYEGSDHYRVLPIVQASGRVDDIALEPAPRAVRLAIPFTTKDIGHWKTPTFSMVT